MASSSPWSRTSEYYTEPQAQTHTMLRDDGTTWEQPQYVQLTEVEVVPTSSTEWSQPPRQFSLPAVPPPSSVTNTDTATPQADTSADILGPPETRTTNKKKKDNGTCTLEELWHVEGKDFGKVELSKDERRHGVPRRKGLASMTSAPECFICGSKLEFNDLGNPFTCAVCGIPN